MLLPALAGFAGLAVFVLLLELAVKAGWISPLVVAPPSAVGDAFGMLFAEERLHVMFLITLAQAFVAILLAVAFGLPAGYWLYRHARFGRAYESWLGALFAAPMVLLYPLFLVIFGRSLVTLVIMGALTGVIPIIIKMREGLMQVPQTLINVGLSFNIKPRDMVLKILFPAAAPAAFTGIRLGLIYALVNIIGIEFLIDYGGLGRLASDMYFRYEIPAMYGVIVFIVLVSTLFIWLLNRCERWLRPV
jgi:ABC-type nitrate/sulfonate/bicarbonate transport system permease component